MKRMTRINTDIFSNHNYPAFRKGAAPEVAEMTINDYE
jgi:hypothetical protein